MINDIQNHIRSILYYIIINIISIYCGYGYKVVCCYDDKYSKPVQKYKGENAVHKFMEKMLKEVQWCKKNET